MPNDSGSLLYFEEEIQDKEYFEEKIRKLEERVALLEELTKESAFQKRVFYRWQKTLEESID